MTENEFDTMLSAYKREMAELEAYNKAKKSQSTQTQESMLDNIFNEPCLFSQEELIPSQAQYKSYDEIMEKRLRNRR